MYYEWSQNYISCKIVHVASAPWSVRISTFTLVSHGNASTTESLNACSCRFCCKSSNSVGVLNNFSRLFCGDYPLVGCCQRADPVRQKYVADPLNFRSPTYISFLAVASFVLLVSSVTTSSRWLALRSCDRLPNKLASEQCWYDAQRTIRYDDSQVHDAP